MSDRSTLQSPTSGLLRGGLTAHEKIDACRGLFAFMVVVAHSLELAWRINPQAPDRLHWLTARLLECAVGNGISWVMGFFVISGYCIYLSAVRLIDGDSFPLKKYLVARITRIVPLYYLALFFTALVEWWIAANRPGIWPNGLNSRVFLYQILLIQKFTETYGSYAPSWSITNEAIYYVIFGLIVAAVVRLGKRPAAIGTGLCLLIGIVAQLVYRLGHRSSVIFHVGLLFGLGVNWFLGALVAENRDRLVGSQTVRTAARFWPLALAASIGIWCTQRVSLEVVFVGGGIAFTLMLLQFLIADRQHNSGPKGQRRWQVSFTEGLGLSSYPTYLFHGPIITFTGWMIIQAKVNLDWRVTWAIAAIVAIASGTALGYLAEKPILAWRAALLKRTSRPRPDPARTALERPVVGINV